MCCLPYSKKDILHLNVINKVKQENEYKHGENVLKNDDTYKTC